MEEFPNLVLVKSKVIAANPCFSHFLAAAGIDSSGVLIRSCCLLADLFISLFNNLMPYKTGFLVAHVYESQ